MKKILYGICGIGNGHLYRQIPVIKNLLSQQCKVLIFSYGNSYDYFKTLLENTKDYDILNNLEVVQVQVPYYIGNNNGLDFINTEKINTNVDFSINLKAFAKAQEWLGKPDLVISDYEPICAQYGYAYGTKVVTIDQQSKYLCEKLPQPLENQYYNDEIMRLKMFFPIATQRIVCSFFNVDIGNEHNLYLVPPLIRNEIKNISLKRNIIKNEYLIYISAQEGYSQSLSDIVDVLTQYSRHCVFHIFLPRKLYDKESITIKNIKTENNIRVYLHGNKVFEEIIATCSGIICTAGHSLLSEAMYLNIPVYALPLNLYEQKLSAHIIDTHSFGVKDKDINVKTLTKFISNISNYKDNIINDQKILLKNNNVELLQVINNLLQ